MRALWLVLVMVACVNAKTWYVRSTGGSNDSAGTTFAKALATTQAAWDSVGAGDTVRLCGGTFTLTATDTLDMNGGTVTSPTYVAPVYVFGADTIDGTIKNGTTAKTTITTNSELANGLVVISYEADHFRWHGIKFDGGGDGKAKFCVLTKDTAGYADGHIFTNCRFANADSHNICFRTNTSTRIDGWFFISDSIDNAGKGGVGSGMAARSGNQITVRGCYFGFNDDAGIAIAAGATHDIETSIFCRNGTHGISTGSAFNGTPIWISQCVFFANTGNGIDGPNSAFVRYVLINNIFRSNGGYAVDFNGADADVLMIAYNNCYSNNTGGQSDAGTLPGTGAITDDPLFTTETSGSEVFTLQAASPCKNAGYETVGY
jgi:hypothetical protein